METIEQIDLSTFTVDHHFYGELDLLLTVKSFNLQEIRKRYLNSLKNVSGKRGSVERRSSAVGGIARITVAKGKILEESVLTELLEPRGIAAFGEMLAISSENKVFLIDEQGVREFTDPWFSYIHTLDFNQDGTKLLVSSSGFDALFEYDVRSLSKNWEWFAWEHGLNKGTDPDTGAEVTLSRNVGDVGKDNHLVIRDPAGQVLPTAMRAAFINSVEYDTVDENRLLATLFHRGEVICIDQSSGEWEMVLDNLKTPHGGRRHGGDYLATSTGSGEVVIGTAGKQTRYGFGPLPGKDPRLGHREWIQNSIVLGSLIVSIDSNRNSFVVFDPVNRLIDMIPYDHNWAVQDMLVDTVGSAVLGHVPLLS